MTAWKQQLYSRIGDRVREERNRADLSRDELAKRVGTTGSTLSQIEAGVSVPPVHLLVALADEFDVTLDSLVPVSIKEAAE